MWFVWAEDRSAIILLASENDSPNRFDGMAEQSDMKSQIAKTRGQKPDRCCTVVRTNINNNKWRAVEKKAFAGQYLHVQSWGANERKLHRSVPDSSQEERAQRRRKKRRENQQPPPPSRKLHCSITSGLTDTTHASHQALVRAANGTPHCKGKASSPSERTTGEVAVWRRFVAL